MYASNEEEDWVYLHKTPPVKTISEGIVYQPTEYDSNDLERENRLLEMTSADEPFLSSQTECDHDYLQAQTLTVEENELVIPDENPTIECKVPHRCTTETAQQTDPIARPYVEQYQNQNSRLVSCTGLIVLLTLPFIFGRIITPWDQPTMNQIAKELAKTNQRLNEIRDMPIGNVEERLTKQIQEKMQTMINQQIDWYEHEKSVFISQIHGLRQILKKTQQNFTDNIYHLNAENERLQEQIKSLEKRLEVNEEQSRTDCIEGVNCTKSSRLTLDQFMTNLFKRTASIAADTSVNLSDLFEHLSASVSNIVDHRHKYIEASQQKLTDLTRLSPTERVQRSFRKAKSTYTSWMESRSVTNRKLSQKFPWRWRFSRGSHHGRMYFPSPDNEQVCYSKFNFPLNKICSMKHWMGRLFRL